MQKLLTPLYLAQMEVLRNKVRFFLISLLIALITLLVLFIAALAEGLGGGNREYISKLEADLLVYKADSDLLIAASRLPRSVMNQVRRVAGVHAVGPIAVSNAAIDTPLETPDADPLRVALLGVEAGLPGAPPIISGSPFSTNRAPEAVVERRVIQRLGIKVGDRISIRTDQGSGDETFEMLVVGLSDGQQYGLAPVVFLPLLTWDRVRSKTGPNSPLNLNLIAVQLEDPNDLAAMKALIPAQVKDVEMAGIREAYEALPGYKEQQSTLDTQRFFTLIIGVLVIGGFFQIQALQKVPQVGMLKAIGAANWMVAVAAIAQIILVTVIGVLLGGAATLLLASTLPPGIPIVFTGQAAVAAIVSLLFIGPIGGAISIRYAARIEPLKALGMSS